MRVLIVENDAIIAMYLAMLVADFGHAVCGTADSASGAIEQAADHSPDLALMDIRLANGSSGIDAARELHERHGLRCIFLSANLDEPTKLTLAPLDPIDFIGKPVLPVLLKQSLDKAQADADRQQDVP
jgi:DNA-binding NarL/FixJ family response regulator